MREEEGEREGGRREGVEKGGMNMTRIIVIVCACERSSERH